MANFKPDMSWRDDERVQRVTEQPSGGAHSRLPRRRMCG